MIDPIKVDPEHFIELSLDLDSELREIVHIYKIKGDVEVDVTVELLNAVYKGVKTDMKRYACQQLKNKIMHEIIWFQINVSKYKQTQNDENKQIIEHMISSNSIFSAFKRLLIRRDPELSNEFY